MNDTRRPPIIHHVRKHSNIMTLTQTSLGDNNKMIKLKIILTLKSTQPC